MNDNLIVSSGDDIFQLFFRVNPYNDITLKIISNQACNTKIRYLLIEVIIIEVNSQHVFRRIIYCHKHKFKTLDLCEYNWQFQVFNRGDKTKRSFYNNLSNKIYIFNIINIIVIFVYNRIPNIYTIPVL